MPLENVSRRTTLQAGLTLATLSLSAPAGGGAKLQPRPRGPMNPVDTPIYSPLLSALDPGFLAAVWAAVSVVGLLLSLLAGAVLGRC